MLSRWIGLLAVAGVLLAVGLLPWIALRPAPATRAPATAGPAAAAATGAPAAASSASPAPPGPPSTPPAPVLGDVRWVDFHGVRVPVSGSAGPRESPGEGAAVGFAETPAGAVMAAVHIVLRLDARFGPRVYRPTLALQVIGPDKPAAAAEVEAAYAAHSRVSGTPPGEPASPVYVSFVGFRLEGFTSGWSVVHLLIFGPAGTAQRSAYADYRVVLQWSAGDWRVLAPPGGDWQANLVVVPGLSGYTRFEG